jgi:DNA-binding response OmpR family regulator
MDSTQGPRVLIVEDDEDTRYLVHLILEDAGYQVDQVADGAAALEWLRASREPVIVLLDWWLPGLDGLHVIQALSEEAPHPVRHAYILITAAYELLVPRLEELPNGLSVWVIPKPFRLEGLLAAVAEVARDVGSDSSACAS